MSAHSDRLLREKELVAAAGATKVGPFSRVKRTDPAAVEQALRQHYPGLVALLMRRIGDRQLALDVLHDAIVTALTKLEAGTPVAPEVLAGFVFRTAMNHLRNHRRNARTRGGNEGPIDALPADSGLEPVEQSQKAGMRELVRNVLQGLPSPRDREVLVRFYLDDEDKMQICESFDLTGPQFDRVIYRARDRLRELVERSGCSRWDLLGLALLVIVISIGTVTEGAT